MILTSQWFPVGYHLVSNVTSDGTLVTKWLLTNNHHLQRNTCLDMRKSHFNVWGQNLNWLCFLKSKVEGRGSLDATCKWIPLHGILVNYKIQTIAILTLSSVKKLWCNFNNKSGKSNRTWFFFFFFFPYK